MSAFELLRDRISIREVVERCTEVEGSKACCVSGHHPDNRPSMHLYSDHVHCFSCGFHGDVVDVWGAQRSMRSSMEAALDLAREFNVKLPEMSEEGRQKAEEYREKARNYLRLARVCHAALQKHEAVRGWWEGRGFGADLQERFLLGVNKDGTQAVIPFWNRGRVQGLIRRKLDGEPKYLYPSTEEFIDGYRPLFVPDSARGEVFVVEGIVDALAIVAAGRAAVAVGGINISEAQMQDLQRLLPKNARLFVLPDDDESGEG
ncbi:MAG: toprim domain-containing protein, partial [Actinobacteria bacterium]|nr:toprim domain-containing protein [Actinomycetota bacterium]